MFDSVVQIQLGQVKSVFAVALIQHVRGKVWDKKAEGWRKVACGSNCFIKLFERDVSTVMREETWLRREQGQ
jgi:hypothetical protein